MTHIYGSISELIGNTPLYEPKRFAERLGAGARLLVKLEYFNPAGSAKDRIARAMLDAAENGGLIAEGSVIVEPTSGNTGIGLAAVARSRGYRVVLVMPDTMSVERRQLLAAYGAEVVLTDGKKGMQGAIDEAERICRETPESFMPRQFENPANPAAHFHTTGPEIWADSGGCVDIFVAGVGTGGTVSGVGSYLKSMRPDMKIVAVEPAESPLLSGGSAGAHGIQGIGANFIPAALDRGVLDEVVTVTTESAITCARRFAESEGLLIGISSGAALSAAAELAKRPDNRGKTIVALLPDSGERYLSTTLFKKD